MELRGRSSAWWGRHLGGACIIFTSGIMGVVLWGRGAMLDYRLVVLAPTHLGTCRLEPAAFLLSSTKSMRASGPRQGTCICRGGLLLPSLFRQPMRDARAV